MVIDMIDKKIQIDGAEYVFVKKFAGKNKKYVEFRSEKLGKIKFFELKNGNLAEINDKEDLKNAVSLNYTIKE